MFAVKCVSPPTPGERGVEILAVGQCCFGGGHSPDVPLDASVASGVYGNDRAKNRTHLRHRCVTFTQKAQFSSIMRVAKGRGLL